MASTVLPPHGAALAAPSAPDPEAVCGVCRRAPALTHGLGGKTADRDNTVYLSKRLQGGRHAMGRIVGIDFGTTNSVVAVVEHGEPRVIPDAEGRHITPSVVAFAERGGILVGHAAKRQAALRPEQTVFSIKRLLGREFDSPGVAHDVSPCHVVEGPKGMAAVRIGRRDHAPEEIAAALLLHLKTAAEAYLAEPVNRAVVTVPAYFNNEQRTAIANAGAIAGLDIIRMVNEPTAACLAYGLFEGDMPEESRVLVLDLGGGTFDVSLVEVDGSMYQVEASCGDTHLGGDDWDACLTDYMIRQFIQSDGIDLRKDTQAIRRLREAAEQAKVGLSTSESAVVRLPFIAADATGAKHMDLAITRQQFEEMSWGLLRRMEGPLKDVLESAHLDADELSEVLLVGGATRMPMVRDLVSRLCGRTPYDGIAPEQLVALGAATHGAMITGELRDCLLIDVTPLSLGVETLGGVMTKMIQRNTAIPTQKSDIFTTPADDQTEVEIHVLQGERQMANENHSLGRFRLTGIPPAPKGKPKIEVTFDVDANGILSVSARDVATEAKKEITISGSGRLTKSEIDEMARQAGRWPRKMRAYGAAATRGAEQQLRPRTGSEGVEEQEARFDAFLAHNTIHKPEVESIAARLRARGLAVWLDKEQIAPGRWFQDEIEQAIPRVRSAAVFIGPGGLGKWQVLEVRMFVVECVESGVPVIPVLLPGVDGIPAQFRFLRGLRWVKFGAVDDTAALDELEWGIRGQRPAAEV